MNNEHLGFSSVQQKREEAPADKRSVFQESLLRFGLISLGFVVLIVVSSVFFRIAIYIPTPWITAVLYLYMAPIFLYSISAMARPWMVVAICFPSLVLGEILWTSVYGSAGELLLNVIIALNAWGIGCLLISFFRKRNIGLAMFTGGAWSFFGLIVPTIIYYNVILNWNVFYMIAYSLFSMALNLALIPVAYSLNYVIRRQFRLQDLEELIFF
ncbi:MAG: hypothetical protein ACFFD8_10585 [Candidatus Thorarchaeota archaeon]